MDRLRVTATGGFWAALGLFWFVDDWGLLPPFLLAAGLHEAAHLAVLDLLGIPVYGLTLCASGAVISADLRGSPREAWAAAAGPAANLLLAGLFWRAWPLFGLCCLALGCCNLLPLAPLDGGRLCALLLPWLLGGPAGGRLCRALHWLTLALLTALAAWAACVLHWGALPLLAVGAAILAYPYRPAAA